MTLTDGFEFFCGSVFATAIWTIFMLVRDRK
jgi:hypothetical protein